MATTETILPLLQNLRGIEGLRTLFCVELNYELATDPIRELPEGTAELVAEPPLRVATGGRDNDFHVIYVRLKTESFRKTDERQIITHLQTRYPDALYVFSNVSQDRWHFINVKLTRTQQGENGQPRVKQRNLFRRITVGPEERLRTAAERIAMLDLEHIGEPEAFFESRELLTALEIRRGHEAAFDVEAVTAAFFENYKAIFRELQEDLAAQTGDAKWAHDHAQQFLSRCLFLYFVQRKRWLGEDTEFLRTFWEAYRKSSQPTDTFVKQWLNVLFFEAFNNRSCSGYRYFPTEIREVLQLAPYLNGGLFRKNELDTDYLVNVSDAVWENIFGFFERYNFTIAEDTPLDQEVAVDPEMIGKVYESLVSVADEERGDAGIFYTPRVEIDLMCRLSLVDNLANHIGTEADKHLFYEALFAFEPAEKTEADAKLADLWEPIHKHLTELTVLDPACGSGSFLVGMLSVLDDMHERAEQALGTPTVSRFERRKALIGKNLYGVDVKQWACKVAELRLWLALIIDADIPAEELHVRKEPLLPNFSFNIRWGDSIVQDIGGMNLAQTRAIGSGVSWDMQRKIEEHQTEKRKFYNNAEDRKYAEERDLEAAEQGLFRELLGSHELRLSREIRAAEAWLEDPAEQLTLEGLMPSEPRQLSIETVQKQQELTQHKENRSHVQRARDALSSGTTPPFVWDIAFVEIFSQRGGFDIVIENPPYIRQEDIRDLMLPREEGLKPANKKLYKAKLARAVYQAHPRFFGYQPEKDSKPDKPEAAVRHKLSGRSDLYMHFYLHGLSLLNPKGTFCSITSNSWLDAGFGANLKEFLLTQCHLKLLIDNTARRSFKGVNINTVISITSAPCKNQEVNLENTTRFVNFTVPFEAILAPIIFYEIETALARFSTREHRIHSLSQRELFTTGLNVQNRYIGEGWGGKYFRSPDIYWTILRRGKDKLVRIGKIADLQLGIKTGANDFFILDQSTISKWNIESEFLKPLIANLEESRSILVQPEHLPSYIFICPKEKNELNGTAALAYVEWGETQKFHETRSCKIRSRWYDIGQRAIPHLNFPRRTPSTTAKTFYTPEGCYALDKFVDVHVPANIRELFCFYLNSTIFQLIVNVNGRSSLGYGALEVQTSDLKTLLCLNLNLLNLNGGGKL